MDAIKTAINTLRMGKLSNNRDVQLDSDSCQTAALWHR